MKSLFNKKNTSRLLALLLFFVVNFFYLPVQAASLSSLSDTMSRLKVSTASDHTIKFTTPTGVDSSTDTITITMPTGFTIGSVDYTDIDLSHGPSTGYETEETLAAAPGSGVWGAAFSGQVLTLTAPTNATTGEIASNAKVVVEIGLNATGGNAQITNSSSANTYIIPIGGTFGDSGSMAIVIITDDQIPVTATVDPSITLTVANTTLNLGILSPSSISTSSENNIVIGTNGSNGYSISVKDIGNGSSAGLYNANSSKLIASSTTTLSAGTEGYGVNCNKTSGDGTCSVVDGSTNNVTGLSLAGITFASYSSKPTGNTTFRIRVKAAISTSTDAGFYNDTLTVVGTANF